MAACMSIVLGATLSDGFYTMGAVGVLTCGKTY